MPGIAARNGETDFRISPIRSPASPIVSTTSDTVSVMSSKMLMVLSLFNETKVSGPGLSVVIGMIQKHHMILCASCAFLWLSFALDWLTCDHTLTSPCHSCRSQHLRYQTKIG